MNDSELLLYPPDNVATRAHGLDTGYLLTQPKGCSPVLDISDNRISPTVRNYSLVSGSKNRLPINSVSFYFHLS
ncbi:hypothetical protein TNIN_425761 [Trichonephila inaurata madagascariensis]|uniref:Uncharacterized protein n=1 Tax=Trichonephila inaurata madagascariensis TaxID=2747483 RepID=A0A8X6YQ58_9ARAC|nr:hypothetical protein TNIN_425761 [Trichonephila inaurata madagascariensis]